MDKHVKVTLEIKAPSTVGLAAWIAAARELRMHGKQPVQPVDGHAQMMARNLMIVRALPCERE
jgi:hypothetical protein